MNSRRKFLQLLGLAAPAAALAPELLKKPPVGRGVALTSIAHPISGVITREAELPYNPPMRYLGLAQLKNEGDPTCFDPGAPDFSDEIARFSKEAFGRKELYQWPDNDYEEDLDS